MSEFSIPTDFFSINAQPKGTRVAFIDANNQIVKEIGYQDEPNVGITNYIKVVNNTYVITHDGGSFAYAQNYATVNLNNKGQVYSEVFHQGADYVELYYSPGNGALKTLPTSSAPFEIPKVVLVHEYKAGQYEDQRTFDNLGNVTSRSFQALNGSNLSLVATWNQLNNTYSETLVRSNGVALSVHDLPGNINKVITHDGGSLISNDGGSLVAGGNLISHDGGSLKLENLRSVITHDGGSLISNVGKSVASVITHDGGSLNGQLLAFRDGSGFAALVSQGGGNLVKAIYGLQSTHDGEVGDTAPPPLNPADDFRDNADGIGPGIVGAVTVNGTPVSGNLEILGDRDWFAVNLTAGTTYTIELKGADTGDGTIIDPALRLYNNSPNLATSPATTGVFIASNDDTGTNHNAKLTFTASYSGTYYLEAGSSTYARIENGQGHDYAVSSGTYKLSVATTNATPYFYAQNNILTPELFRSTTIAENTPSTTSLLTARGYGATTGTSGITYSKAGGPDADKFFINPTNGSLGFASNFIPDYERPADFDGDNIYKVTLKVEDNITHLSSTQEVSVIVSDVNEPAFTFPNTPSHIYNLNVAENSGNLVTYIEAYEGGLGGAGYSLNYTLEGPDAYRFSLGPQSNGKYLYWQTGINPDFETPRDVGFDNKYEVIVKAENPSTHLYDKMYFVINVTDQPDPSVSGLAVAQTVNDDGVVNPFANVLVANSNSVKISLSTAAYGTFTAASLSSAGFSATGVANEWSRSNTLGDLSSALRSLVFDPLNNSVADGQQATVTFTVFATDGSPFSTTETSKLTIYGVPDGVNHAPVITSNGGGLSADVYINENTTAVTFAHATDVDAGQTIGYYISQFSKDYYDGNRFSLNPTTGELKFISAPNFENPQGAVGGNNYYVEVEARDNGNPVATDTQGIWVHVQDVVEQAAGSVAINDVTITEGNSGSKLATFTLTRTGGTAAFSVNYSTANGTATTADNDYAAASGTLNFSVNQTTATFTVTINGDTKVEANETFVVNLSAPTNGVTIGDSQGVGTIVNDDVANANSPNLNGDHNGDHKTDLLFFNPTNSGMAIWQMDGTTVVKNPQIGTVNTAGGWHYQTKGDFNGDGMTDLLFLNDKTNGVAEWQMNGTTVVANPQIGTINAAGGWRFVDVADFNGDGKSDLFFLNDITHGVAEWIMDGTTVVANPQVGTINASGGWQYLALADLNGDHKSDILFFNPNTSGIAVWQMDGTTVVKNPQFGTVNTAGGWHFAKTGDFNADGKSDLLFLNDRTNGVAIWQMDGTTVVANPQIGTMNAAGGWRFVDVGDFNGDHKSDLFFLNDTTHGVAIWQMDGTTVTANPQIGTINASGGWHYTGLRDFNGDGKTDILFENDSTHGVAEWIMDGTTVVANPQVGTINAAGGWHLVG